MKIYLFLFSLLISSLSIAQSSASQTQDIDFISASASVQINPDKSVTGKVHYDINILNDVNSIYVDAVNLDYHKMWLDNKVIDHHYDSKALKVNQSFKKNTTIRLSIQYAIRPTQALYFIDADNDGNWDQAWTQGQGKYTSHWLPSIDDVNDKMIWNLSIEAPKQFNVIANGILENTIIRDAYKDWSYSMDMPMSSYLVAVAIGDYDKEIRYAASNTPIELYYYKGAQHKVNPTYKHTARMFNFLESEIGIAYPWGIYKQIPVKDFLYSGMENTTATLFSDAFFIDEIAYNDTNYITVNAHEMAHQWFGNLVTAQSSKHQWLQEGFATYYSMLAEKDLYGENRFYYKLFESAEKLIEQSKNSVTTAVLDENASTLTFYEHGAWALHALKDEIGEVSFRKSVKQYTNTYAFKTVTTDDFLEIASTVSGKDLSNFKKLWLETESFPASEALRLLRKNLFMTAFFQLAARRVNSFDEAFYSYKDAIRDGDPILIDEVLFQLTGHKDNRKEDLIIAAAQQDNIDIRQSISYTLNNLSDKTRPLVKTMLQDSSYATRENALYLMWNDNTSTQKELLESVKKEWKTTTPSLEMAWLAMAINTRDYKNNEIAQFIIRLQEFTGSQHSIATRNAAFDYLLSMGIMNEQTYVNLVLAAAHHNWRFYKNARDILSAQYKRMDQKVLIDKALTLAVIPDSKRKKINNNLRLE